MSTDSRARNELFRVLQPIVNMCKLVLTEQADNVPPDRIDVSHNQMMDMLPGLSLRAYKTLAGAKGLGQTLAALHTSPVQFGNRTCASSYAQLAVDTAIALVMTLDGFHCELRGDRAEPGRMFGALASADGYWHLLDAGEFVPWAADPGYQFSAEQIVELRRRLYNLPNFRYKGPAGDRSQQIGRDFAMLRAGLEQEAATLAAGDAKSEPSGDGEPDRSDLPVPDGPFPPDGFAWDGKRYDGMTLKAWCLVDCLWQSNNRTKHFDDLAGPVWGDCEEIVDENRAGAARREANRFFQDRGIPWKTGIKGQYVKLSLPEDFS